MSRTAERASDKWSLRHGDPGPFDLAAWLSDDPELALVTADMDAWHEAHPCECPALCECDEDSE